MIEQLEDLLVLVIEEIRERPAVLAAIAAAIVGALIGIQLAERAGRPRVPAPGRVARRARGIADAGELAGLGLRLLQNPIVRSYLRSALQQQLKRPFVR